MSLLGINMTLLIGSSVAVPAPPTLMEAMESVEVTHSDEGHSGFQIAFQVGRSGPGDLLDYAQLTSQLLKPFYRVVVLVTFNAIPRVLMDGVITDQQLTPSNDPGTSMLTITGEDVSVMMDLEEKSVEHPAQNEMIIANKIILSYAQYGMKPKVIPPQVADQPIPTERTPVQQDTDLGYLLTLAKRHGYVFYITPGPAPLTNTAYWGPPNRVGLPQRALSMNMGPDTNLESINFRNNAMAPTTLSGVIQDRNTNQSITVKTISSTRPPLSSQPALLTQNYVRQRLYRAEAGLNAAQANARAQGMTDKSTDVITAEGELDALQYGDLLQARGLVDLRGVGYSYNGTYYVQRVTHTIRQGDYKQRFTLSREGIGALSPMVRT